MRPENVYMVREEKSIDKVFVLNFLEEHFFTREPLLTIFLKMNAAEISPVIRETMLADLRRRYDVIVSSCSMFLLGVQCETGRQVGVGLGILELRQNHKEVPEWDKVPIASEMLVYWFRHVQIVAERRVDFFEMFMDVNTIMRIVLIGVEEDHENKRIATNMLREMVERAKKRGADLIYGLFTSKRLRLLAEKFGFRSYGDMQLTDFRDPLGNIIYSGVEPHVVAVMAIKLI